MLLSHSLRDLIKRFGSWVKNKWQSVKDKTKLGIYFDYENFKLNNSKNVMWCNHHVKCYNKYFPYSMNTCECILVLCYFLSLFS